ncbi:chitin-binding lectin 1-like isoform X2 [Prunus avium]|uniref:Chitin-binding lectin 1-like isoform X2 n=2 Tax=Prunus avium TaxID=42229 RepID=A0A6P5TLU1_PRUAV|nr:chitin-binding lectin 1-like isoform X2 [Prunus avium]
MAEKEKVTTMVLKVDLQCHKCYKKVKKVLCKFPQIRDQTYDEKQNQVVIKVVCCSPEKIRDRICCKGGGAIKSIEIKEPEKPKPQPPKPQPPKPVDPPPNPPPPRVPACHPPPKPVNVNACCMDCYHGHPGGPCQTGYGRVALCIQYDGYYGRPVYDSCGGCRSYNTNYCVARSDCCSEENPQGCTVM